MVPATLFSSIIKEKNGGECGARKGVAGTRGQVAGQWAVAAAFAREHGISQKQVSYWSRRLAVAQPAPGFLPVRVTSAGAAEAISLRSAQGCNVTLPRDVPANWLAELMRAL